MTVHARFMPPQRRGAIELQIEALLQRATVLIAWLDCADGNPDLEPDDDDLGADDRGELEPDDEITAWPERNGRDGYAFDRIGGVDMHEDAEPRYVPVSMDRPVPANAS